MKICLAQLNPTIAAFEKNKINILKAINKAEKENCDLIIFPELALSGYPPQDLLLDPNFMNKQNHALNNILKESKNKNINCIIGLALEEETKNKRYNAAILYCSRSRGWKSTPYSPRCLFFTFSCACCPDLFCL
eukprot:COSAG01_NODE_44694_length_416_cov_1.249211_1_plen_134_part_01